MKSELSPLIRLEDYTPPDFLIPKTHLEFMLHPTETLVTATLKIIPQGGDKPLILDGDELTLVSAKISGVYNAQYEVTPTALIFKTVPNKPFTLTIKTKINPTANTKLMGLYRSNGTFCTQCEAQGFRRITYFLDRPDVLSVYTVRIESPIALAPYLLSNGNLVKQETIGKWHFAEWQDPYPKPSYLFALVGGDLAVVSDKFKTMSGREVDLQIYVEHGKENRVAYAMDALKRSFAWDEKVFGREYDLDIFMIVAVSDFNMGAMENKGLNIFNDKYVLADPLSATDADYANIEAIIAHEYFHNWTGNRITCRDWFQLSLKEGLTVFRDQEFTSDMRSRPVKRIEDVRILKASQFSEDAGPLAHPVRPRQYSEINNFYTATVYNKGAEVIRMMKVQLGKKLFAKGLDLYFNRYDGTATTIENFVACFEEVSGKSLAQHSLWYEQAGTPLVRAQSSFKNNTLTLELEQVLAPSPNQFDKKPQVIPLITGFLDENGKEIGENTLIFNEMKHIFTFTDLKSKPILSLNRGFSAAINIDYECNDEELAFLATYDTDDYNRWQALQTYALRLLKALVKGNSPDLTPFITLYGKLLAECARDPAFFAHALSLPSEEDIAREIGLDIDPDLNFSARQSLVKAVASAHSSKALELYHVTVTSSKFSPSAKEAGLRALRLALLRLALQGGMGEAEAVALYTQANNLTERFGALAIINQNGSDEARKNLLEDFKSRFENEPIILDKFYAVVASRASSQTLNDVKALLNSEDFAKFNPNRYRALVGTFAMANATQFHAKTGEGYAFLAEDLLRIDAINPQVSARVANAFRSIKALEPVRRDLAHNALQGLNKHPLSSDLKDIVTRILA